MKKLLSFLLIACLVVFLAVCGSDEPMTVTVTNMTGYTVGDLRMSPERGGEWGGNRLDEPLLNGESVKVDLGGYSEDEVLGGFGAQLFDEYDISIGAIRKQSLAIGDTVIFYMDGSNLAARVNGE
jgi:hypothetical protein